MTLVRALVVAVAVAGVSVAADEKPAFDAAKAVGNWKITAGTKAGEKLDTTKYKDPAVIAKDTIVLKTEEATFEFKYTADAKASPATIDLEIVKPDGFKGAKAKGLIKLDGDTLTLVYNPDGEGKRPEKFESTADNKFFLFSMKKDKAEK
jgi:uncharacterized protein (TIGR03067 family)